MKKTIRRMLAPGICLLVLAAGCSNEGEPEWEKAPDPERYVLVEGGTYWRGSPDVDFTANNEYPQHKASVSSFYIGKYEVTQKEWKDVMGLTVEEQHALSGQPASNFRGAGDNLPINFVNFWEAVEFCNRLSKQDKLTPAYTIIEGGTWLARTVEVEWNQQADGWRLPTEAEWEYACRAGTTTRYNTGAFEEDLARAAWYAKNSEIDGKAMLHPVGTKTPNAWGIYDMHGNVWEWCWDLYVSNYEDYESGALPTIDPIGATGGENRVTRGGAFNNTVNLTGTGSATDFFYCARRTQTEPKGRGQNFGFRIVRSFPSKPANTTVPAKPDLPESPLVILPPPPAPTAPDGFVYAPPGTFMMGGKAEGTTHTDCDPQHSVTLSKGFFISKYEVTQKQWKDVMGKTLSEWLTANTIAAANNKGEGNTLPMNNVNWYDALVFCNKLSIAEGLTPVYKLAGSTNPNSWGTIPTNVPADASLRVFWDAVEWNHDANGYRLPTEAEWEYACRAGTTTKYNTGDTTADLTAAAWYGEGASSGQIHPVGTKRANPWGIFDMHGNVSELCWDLYLANYYAASPAADPFGPDANSNGNRVTRGGAANNPALNAANSNDFAYSARRMNTNMLRSPTSGFRVVRNAPVS